MAPLRTIPAGLCAVCLLLVAVTEGAATTASAALDDVPDASIDGDGDKMYVADPALDPSEADSIQEDGRAEWQLEMVEGLYAQRNAEKEFIDKLEAGGSTLNGMVDNITKTFTQMENARQGKGFIMMTEHFEKEVRLLKNSQQKILSDLSKVLGVRSSDSTAVKFLKTQVKNILEANFKQQVRDEASLFQKQIDQIKKEHEKQVADVRAVFALITNWKDTFRTGLKKSEKKLEVMSQKWDLL